MAKTIIDRHLPNFLAVFLLVTLAALALAGFDQSWDAIAYHLPYAALRTGIVTSRDFVMSAGLQSRYDGFPAFIDLVQGGLWRLFGTPKATALVSPLSIAVLAWYAGRAFDLRAIWTVVIFLAIPILQTALQAAYVDLWTNAFFTLHLLAAWKSLQADEPRPRRHLVISLVALAVAVNSKEQYYALGGLSYGLYGLMLMADRRWTLVMIAGCLFPVVFAAPLLNLVRYGNPIYPMAMPLLGLQGPETAYFTIAPSTAHMPQFVRYLMSMMELDALSHRARGYSIDQGEAEHQPGYHMGGSSGILLFVTIVSLLLCLRRICLARNQKRAMWAIAVLVIAVGNFPGSNELRYFSFVEIVGIIAVLCLLRHLARDPQSYAAGLQTGFRATLVGSALFVMFLTGFVHVMPHPITMARLLEKRRDLSGELAAALTQSDVICYTRQDSDGFLFTDIMHPGMHRSYQVVEVLFPSECPPNSAIVR